MRRRYKILIAFLIVVLAVFVGFIVWAETPPAPMQQAYDALKSDENVTVIQGQWLIFEPTAANYSTGFIFYPGGRINPVSYAPYAHAIASEGYLVVIAPMPFNLAVFGVNSANDIMTAYPNVTSWAVGGHSLGGSMAAQYINDNSGKAEGLALWAAYPPSGVNLSTADIKAVTIHGTNDGLVSSQQIYDSLNQLPPDTEVVEISGGNHAQFGWFGSQSGDNTAEVSRELQQQTTVNATVQILEKISLN
ncbi:MAG: alpha/beta hydrolase [Candidatus Bathyarchaeia archaeon]|jgi:dienelactone hydrolase